MSSLKNYMSNPKLVVVDFPINQYFKENVKKSQIVLHHTASGKGASGDINWWITTPDKIATSFIIDSEGVFYKCFEPEYWGWHLGIKYSTIPANLKKRVTASDTTNLNKTSIGIEIDSWGQLEKRDGKYYAYPNNFGKTGAGTIIPESEVEYYPEGFRGYKYYQKYTDKQIESTLALLCYLGATYGIPIRYESDIFDLNERALLGQRGTFTHCSYRKDKVDIHPQKSLIESWKKL